MFLSAMGISSPVKKIGAHQVTAIVDGEVPEGFKSLNSKKSVIRTADNLVEPTDLMLVSVMLQDELMDVRVDPGALVSVAPLKLIQRLGLENDMGPSNESLKFAVGQMERVIGTIDLQLLLSEDLENTHSFMVADNFYMPFLLGLDFLLSTGAEIVNNEQTLRFAFSEADIVNVRMLIGLKTKDEEYLEMARPCPC
jgi:hypothetical protein